MRRARLVSLAAALGVLLALIGARELADRAGAHAVPTTATAQDKSATAFAASMRGTQPDGRLSVYEGNLQPDVELRYLFDYYLAAQGEKSLPQIAFAIGEDLRSRLASSPDALAQAEALLQRYLEYRRALVALDQRESGTPAGVQAASVYLAARFQRLRELRAQYFSDSEAMGLFHLDELRDADAIRRLAIFENPQLSPAEKQAAYAELDASLPEALREERAAPLRIQAVERQVAQMRASGASDNDIHQFRAERFSADAAHRLQLLDIERQRWAYRIQQYHAQARELLQLPDGPFRIPEALSPAQQGALEELRTRNFTPQERRRLGAYEVSG